MLGVTLVLMVVHERVEDGRVHLLESTREAYTGLYITQGSREGIAPGLPPSLRS